MPYGSVKSTLIASAQSAQDSSAYASLPASLNPNSNGNIAVWSAQEKALGLISPTASGTDGEIGFSTSFPSALWVGAALHELTHAMGRTSGYAPYGIEDLLRYSAPGVHIYAGGTTSYASVDGGTTVLAPYANSSDYGDLATNTADPFNAYIPSSTNSLTATDTTLMDIIGFTLTPGTASGAKPSFVASATTTAPTAAPGDALFGELANFSGVYRGPSYDDDPPAGILTAQPMAMGALASTVAGAHPFLAGLLHG